LDHGTRGANALVSVQRLGAYAAIELFVFIQFVEYTLFSIDDFVVSVQKVASLIVLPVALILMAKIRIPLLLLVLFGAMSAGNSLWYVVQGDVFSGVLLSANLSAALVFVGAVALYSALSLDSRNFQKLGDVWVRWAVITSIITILQSLSILPLFTVPPDALQWWEVVGGFYRGVGLKSDPGFQSIMLAISSVFVIAFVRRGNRQLLYLTLIFFGVLATFSRMGLLLFLVAAVLGSLTLGGLRGQLTSGAAKTLLFAAGVSAFVLILLATGYIPDPLIMYFQQRYAEVRGGLDILLHGGSVELYGYLPPTSAQVRALQLIAAIRIFQDNVWAGIGAFRSEELLGAETGQLLAAHNTYVEIALTGGLLGLVFLVVYFVPFFRMLAFVPRFVRGSDEQRRLLFLSLMLYITIAVGFMFLSFNYNSILYLPVVVSLAFWNHGREKAKGT
jgi:hypothetical protein